jgi:thioredoxin-related protein
MRTGMSLGMALLAFLGGISSVNAGDAISWKTNYAAAREEASRLQRPLLIDVGAEWCSWCKKLDATTFRDPSVVKKVQAGFVAIRVDAGKDQKLSQDLKAQSLPTIIVASADGKILGRKEGYVSAPDMVNWLSQFATSEAQVKGNNDPSRQPKLLARGQTEEPLQPKGLARGQIEEPPLLEAASDEEPLPHCKVTFKISKGVRESHSGKEDFTVEEEQLARRYLSLSDILVRDKQTEQSNEYLRKALAICPPGELRDEIRQRVEKSQPLTVGMTPSAN